MSDGIFFGTADPVDDTTNILPNTQDGINAEDSSENFPRSLLETKDLFKKFVKDFKQVRHSKHFSDSTHPRVKLSNTWSSLQETGRRKSTFWKFTSSIWTRTVPLLVTRSVGGRSSTWAHVKQRCKTYMSSSGICPVSPMS